MKVKELMDLDLRRNPLITIDQSLDKYTNDPIPQIKIDKCNDAIKNSNLLEVLAEIKNERIIM